MRKDTVTRVLITARDVLDTRRADAGARGSRFVAPGLEHLGRIVEHIHDDIHRADLAETVLVYQLAAEQVAKLTGATTAETFAALAEFCGDEELRPHLAGSPSAPSAVVAALHGRVLSLKAVYDGAGRRVTREIQIIHPTPDGRAVRLTVSHEFGWHDLPPGIRERLITGPGPVCYQLHPPVPAGEEGD
jgi:hypothetical protein